MDNQPPVYQQQPVYVQPMSAATQGASTTALWVEIIFGLFGLLGIGHVYSGRIKLGIGLLLGWWVYIFIAFFVSLGTLGLAACFLVPISIAVPIVSGIQARTYVQRVGGIGDWSAVAKVAGGGCLGMILLVVFLSLVIGGLGAMMQ
jgi:hypothetical protein